MRRLAVRDRGSGFAPALGWALLGAAVTAALLPSSAAAHGLVGRSDLPLPDWLFAWGSSIILIASFVGLTLGWRQVRFEEYGWRSLGDAANSTLRGMPAQALCGAIGALLLAFVVWTGLDGVDAPDRNFSVTFIFVTFWLGLVGLSVLFGDVFRAFNPWRAIGRAVAARVQQARRPAADRPLHLPRTPRPLAGCRSASSGSSSSSSSGARPASPPPGLTPKTLTVAVLVYSAYTFVAMGLFGVERWIDRGETFAQYFGMFASLVDLRGPRRPDRAAALPRRHDDLGPARRLARARARPRSARPPSTAPRRER